MQRSSTIAPSGIVLRFLAIAAFLLCFVTQALAQPSPIRVQAPNGGEHLVVDSTFNIRWSNTNVTGTLNVEYSIDSGATWKLIDTVTARTGNDTLAWVVPNDTTLKAYVRVTTPDTLTKDRSNFVFSITKFPVPTIRVISPNGGEVYGIDSTIKIFWTGANLTGQLKVEYTADSGKTWKPIATVASHSGTDSLTWNIPNDTTTKAFVRVGTLDTITRDASNGRFTIKTSVKPMLHLLYPNGGEVFAIGDTVRIRWTEQDLTGAVTIDYSADSGKTWKQVGFRQARNGFDTIVWVAPAPATNGALCRVSRGIRDTSDAYFTIGDVVPPDTLHPALTILYPDGNEQFRVDSNVVIIWTSKDITGTFLLFYSNNNGVTWKSIGTIPAKAGDDSLTWQVPNDTTSKALFRMISADGKTADTSNGSFVILPKRQTIGVDIRDGRATGELMIFGSYPNPSAGSSELRWNQKNAADVTVNIFDERGKSIETIKLGVRDGGDNSLSLGGLALPTGTYILDLVCGTNHATVQIVVVR